MKEVNKIIAGLREALASTKCQHEFTYWMPTQAGAMNRPTAWSHTCTKCKIKETVFERPTDYID